VSKAAQERQLLFLALFSLLRHVRRVSVYGRVLRSRHPHHQSLLVSAAAVDRLIAMQLLRAMEQSNRRSCAGCVWRRAKRRR
jgi:hypothetical protein